MHEIHCIKHCHGQREHFSRIKALNAKISKSYKVSLHLHTPGKQSTGAVQLGIACVPRTRQFKISKLWNYSILHIPRICVAYYLDCACLGNHTTSRWLTTGRLVFVLGIVTVVMTDHRCTRVIDDHYFLEMFFLHIDSSPCEPHIMGCE